MEMASPRYQGSIRRNLNSELDVVVSGLKKDNAHLKKTLVEWSHQHSEHNKLVEGFLSLESLRLGCCQPLTAKDENTWPSEQLSKKEGKQKHVVSMRRERSISSFSAEIEEIKKKLVSVSTRCQNLENKVTRTKASTSDEWASTSTAMQQSDALEKNEQWLEYDQQREAYVRATLARMLWLEKQLNEANQARLQQHNEDHSDAMEKIGQMQEHYERFLQKAKEELKVLREKFDITSQILKMNQKWCKEKEREVEELKQQLQTENMGRTSAQGDHHYCSEDEEQWLSAETENLQCRLDEEKRKSAKFELQSSVFQNFLLKRHDADQEQIADLERQITISSHDLEDEKQNCSYLKKQMVRVLKMLQKPKDKSKRGQQDGTSCEAASLRHTYPSSSPLNESFLECPSCRAQYPASRYRELMSHLDICLD